MKSFAKETILNIFLHFHFRNAITRSFQDTNIRNKDLFFTEYEIYIWILLHILLYISLRRGILTSSPRQITIINTGILISGVDYDRLVGFHLRSKSDRIGSQSAGTRVTAISMRRCESAHVCRNRIRKRGRPNSAWRACGSHDGPRDWMSKSELHNAWVTGTRRFSCRDRWE